MAIKEEDQAAVAAVGIFAVLFGIGLGCIKIRADIRTARALERIAMAAERR